MTPKVPSCFPWEADRPSQERGGEYCAYEIISDVSLSKTPENEIVPSLPCMWQETTHP